MYNPRSYCPLPPLPKRAGEAVRRIVDPNTDAPERRPKRKGEVSEARRIDAGFRLLAGEGIYEPDDA